MKADKKIAENYNFSCYKKKLKDKYSLYYFMHRYSDKKVMVNYWSNGNLVCRFYITKK